MSKKNEKKLEDEKLIALEKENILLKNKLKKLNSRLDSIMKVNDRTFKNIFNKNITLEKSLDRFGKILHQGDRQGKSVLVQKDRQEELLLAQSKMVSMGEMIDNIAHQWRQPLSLISTSASALIAKKEYGLSNEEEEIKSLNHMIDITQYLSETINDFREFLHDDKQLSYFRLYDTFKKVEILTKPIIVTNFIKLIIKTEDIELLGIENELIQVFMNLISNSNDAFEKEDKNKIILIDLLYRDESKVVIRFQDSAGGINPSNLKKIFRSGYTTKKDSGGTGIGLSMCKNIIENTFKGTIEAQNETLSYKNKSYKGTTFLITIPLNNTK